MPLDGKILAQAKDILESKSRRNTELLTQREEEVYKKAPIIGALDAEIKETMMELVKVSLGMDTNGKIEDIRKKNQKLQEERQNELKKAGFSIDFLDETYMCTKCNDTGYIKTTICSCLMDIYKSEQTKSLNNLFKLGDESFENFNLMFYDDEPFMGSSDSPRSTMKTIHDICFEYARNFGAKSDNLLFFGTPGLGKTFLSACIARVVADSGFSVVYDTAASIFGKYEDEQFGRINNPEEVRGIRNDIKRYLECDLLVLDDLGTEFVTTFTISALYELINTRLINNKKTIISSNLDVGEFFKKGYTEEIVSRLTGDYQSLNFRGDDIRKKKNAL